MGATDATAQEADEPDVSNGGDAVGDVGGELSRLVMELQETVDKVKAMDPGTSVGPEPGEDLAA